MAYATIAATLFSGAAAALLLLTLLITRKTSRAQLRAYITISDAKIVGVEKLTPWINIQLHNGGQTPAQYVSVRWCVKPAREDGEFELTDGTRLPQPVIGPNQKITVSKIIQPIGFASILTHLAGDDSVFLHAYGEITYRDVFKKFHSTKFRMHIMQNLPLTDGDFMFNAKGNTAD